LNIEKIKYVSNFFEKRYRNSDIYCEACSIEHTGRNAYAIGIWLYLLDKTKDEKYFDIAYDLAKITMSKLQPDLIHGALVFLPGNHDGANQSNSVMDAGMCTDMVSSFLIYCNKNSIEIKEKTIWIDKLAQHIDEYLADASLSKTVINQRLWGLTGIVSFYKLQKREKDKNHIVQVLEKTFKEQNEDYSFGYVANRDDKDPGTYFSVYYYSRLMAYICYAVESVNLQKRYEQNIKNTLTLMYDCLDNNGKKIMELETKKIFFQASYEVESLSHDIYVSKFVNEYYKYGSNKFLGKIESIYLTHIDENGVNSNYENKPNLLCSFIDNSDFIWYIRSLGISIGNIENYEKKDRNYLDAGFIVEFRKDKKIVTLKNDYYSSLGWGGKTDTKIIIEDNNKYVHKGYNNLYSLKYMLKRNYGDIKNMIYTSQYNLKFKKQRTSYFITMIGKYLK